MLQDPKSITAPIAADFEALVAQMTALREDMTKLAHSVTTLAERRGRRMASDISEGMSEAAHYVERRGQSAEAEVEKSITAHPLMALGLAATAGLVIGAMTRR